MTTNDTSFVPEVGPWARDKLECLRKYLVPYTTIMSKQSFKGFAYIDAFAGAGTAKVRKKDNVPDQGLFEIEPLADQDQRDLILGSPRIALELEQPFSQYVFVEMDEKRRNELQKLQEQYGQSRKIKIQEGDCNDYLRGLVAKDINWQEWRGVVFLDPFGTHVPWQTIQALASTKALEVFINFPCMAINRLANNDGNISDKYRKMLDEYFGSPEWYEVMYQTTEDLFGERVAKVDNAARALLNWYRKRLQAEFGYASAARLVRNTKNSPLYYLIFAGPNSTGAKIADHVLSQGEAI